MPWLPRGCALRPSYTVRLRCDWPVLADQPTAHGASPAGPCFRPINRVRTYPVGTRVLNLSRPYASVCVRTCVRVCVCVKCCGAWTGGTWNILAQGNVILDIPREFCLTRRDSSSPAHVSRPLLGASASQPVEASPPWRHLHKPDAPRVVGTFSSGTGEPARFPTPSRWRRRGASEPAWYHQPLRGATTSPGGKPVAPHTPPDTHMFAGCP